MTTFSILSILILYLGWGLYLVIGDFMNRSWQAPMYIVNFRERRGRILSCIIALIKICLWPLVYILKHF